MTEYTVEIADEAWRAIEAQVRYIAIEKQSPENASRWLSRLLAAVSVRHGAQEPPKPPPR